MARPHRSKSQRDADMNTLATLYVKRIPQSEIAKQLGVSQGQISQDLKKLLQHWESDQSNKIDQYKREQLERINVIEEEMWKQWELSIKDGYSETTKSKSGKFVSGKGATITGTAKKEMDEEFWRIMETKGSTRGNMEYMKGVMWCVQERSKIWGLYAPKKIAATNPEGDKEAGLNAREELFAMVERVAERLKPKEDSVDGSLVEDDDHILEADESSNSLALMINKTQTTI